MLTKEFLAGELPTPISNMVHDALSHDLEMLGDVSVDQSSRHEQFEEVKEELDCLLEEVNTYRRGKQKLEKRPEEKEVAMKAMTRP